MDIHTTVPIKLLAPDNLVKRRTPNPEGDPCGRDHRPKLATRVLLRGLSWMSVDRVCP